MNEFSWLYGASQPQECPSCRVAHRPPDLEGDLWCRIAAEDDRKLRMRYGPSYRDGDLYQRALGRAIDTMTVYGVQP